MLWFVRNFVNQLSGMVTISNCHLRKQHQTVLSHCEWVCVHACFYCSASQTGWSETSTYLCCTCQQVHWTLLGDRMQPEGGIKIRDQWNFLEKWPHPHIPVFTTASFPLLHMEIPQWQSDLCRLNIWIVLRSVRTAYWLLMAPKEDWLSAQFEPAFLYPS